MAKEDTIQMQGEIVETLPYVMSHQYESLLKKANFKGGVFPSR